jgi:hypothetical protein
MAQDGGATNDHDQRHHHPRSHGGRSFVSSVASLIIARKADDVIKLADASLSQLGMQTCIMRYGDRIRLAHHRLNREGQGNHRSLTSSGAILRGGLFI